jgi:hypothetical protein
MTEDLGQCTCRDLHMRCGRKERGVCSSPATRLAIVEYGYRPFQDIKLPMCEPCAEFAEKKAQERTT